MTTSKRTPKRTGRKRRKAQYTPSPSNTDKEIEKLKKNQEKIISTINSILTELDKDKSKLHKTPEGMYT